MLLKVLLPALLCMSYTTGRTDTITANISSLILAYENAICSTCQYYNSSRETDPSLITNGNIIYKNLPCKVCDRCKCDLNCRLFGDCCTDLHIGKAKFDFHCHMLQPDDGFLIVSRCPKDAVNYSKEFARKCNNFDKFNLIESTFVSASVGNGIDITFRNIYCAFCNGYTDFKKWAYSISCGVLPGSIADMTDPNAIFSFMMKSRYCSKKQITVGREIYTRKCRPSKFAAKCNSTGHWLEYNADVEASCHAYYNPTTDGYTNIFCQLCNNNFITSMSSCRESYLEEMAPFTGLLAFIEEDEPENPKCEDGYFFDILTEQCLRILCPPFHQLHNTKCTETIRLESLFYILKISLFPYQNQSTHIDNLVNLSKLLLDFYTSTSIRKRSSIDWKFYEFTSRTYCKKANGSYLLDVKQIDVVLTAAMKYSNTFANFTADLSSLQFADVHVVYQGKEYKFVSRLTTANRNIDALLTLDIELFPVLIGLSMEQHVPTLAFSPKYTRRNCAQVMYQESQYIALHNTSILLKQSNILIPESLTTRYVNNSLLVCISTIKKVSENYSAPSTGSKDNSVFSNEKAEDPLTILTVVCLSISLFFLALTFSAYSIFSELRTIPGYNLMFLIKSLFLAQGIFLLAAWSRKYATVCIVIGVLMHYFWLVTFAWMSVCTFHAFSVFRNVLSSINKYTNKRMVMLKYSLFSYLAPGIIITVNIITNYFITNKSSIGYADGKSVCFVNPGMASILAFGVPVLFTILVTGFCFIYTIIAVRRASSERVKLGKKSRGILFTILKLSTITGLSWLFGLLGSLLSFQPFQYVFVILAAGQGLFIFFAFVVNRRVLELCRRRYKPKQSENSSTSTRVRYTTSSGE